MSSSYPRGSEWRKWDLHIHTPASLIANDYGGDTDASWEAFIIGLESMSQDIKVIGINDYLFIDGYKKVLSYKEAGRLPNIALILPVVEFRLKEFVGHDKLKRLNYHIIFADTSLLTPEQIESQFLNGFRGKAKLSAEYAETISWGGTISNESLTDLGQKIIDSMPAEKRPSRPNLVELGFNNINFELSSIEDMLGEGSHPNTYLRDNYLKAIGKSEWEDFRWDGSIADKKSVINGAHIVFSASPDSATAIKSKEALTTEGVNNRLLHCSDAHALCSNADKTITQSKEIGHCFTWIKADTTYEGLKQILHEPEYRLHLGDTRPVQPTNTIDSFTIKLPADATITVEQSNGTMKTESFCFASMDGTYEFSPYFNCLVGGRGTGKSTVLNFLGQHSKEPNSSDKFWDKLNPSFGPKSTQNFDFSGVKSFEFIGQSEVEGFAMNKQAFTDAIYKRADILSDGELSNDEDTLIELLAKIANTKQVLEDLAKLEEAKQTTIKICTTT